MGGENLTSIKKIEIENSVLADLKAQPDKESVINSFEQSVFDEINVSSCNAEKNNGNLVEIKDVEDSENNKQSLFQRFWQALFPLKTTIEDDIVNLEKNTNVNADDLLKIQDYNKLSQEDPKYTVNGEIDQDFSQGNAADCVLLASLYSLSRSEDGAAIIKDAIKINYDEYGATKSYDVYFKGLDKTYNIPVEEYMEAERLRPRYQRGEVERYLSAGDDDMLLMELAYQKAFDDICEEKRSSSMFAQTDALTSVEYEQFLYAFVGTEDVNSAFFLEEKYKDLQVEQYGPKIKEIFETQKEFKLEDVCVPNCQISGMTINSFKFDFNATYIVEKKPSESENGEIVIKNKETGEMFTCEADYLAKCFAGPLSLENKKQVGLDMYNLAIESDFVYFANSSHKPIDVVDTDGKTWSIYQQHAYGVKEITQDYIILINPHNSKEEIKISKEEYMKNYNSLNGFKLFSADF